MLGLKEEILNLGAVEIQPDGTLSKDECLRVKLFITQTTQRLFKTQKEELFELRLMAFKLQNNTKYAQCIGMASQAMQEVAKKVTEGTLNHFKISQENF